MTVFGKERATRDKGDVLLRAALEKGAGVEARRQFEQTVESGLEPGSGQPASGNLTVIFAPPPERAPAVTVP